MLRWILACVVVANLLFLAWSQHWLAPLGLAPLPSGAPERLKQQIAPEAVVILKNAQSARLETPPVVRHTPVPAQPTPAAPAPTTPAQSDN